MPNTNKISNKILIERIKSSDQKAFGVLYDRFWAPMYLKSVAILGNKCKAKDIVQEVWISFWERRHEIDNDNIEGYLFNAIRFKVFNEFRNSKNKKTLIDNYIKYYNTHNTSNNIDDIINLKETQNLIQDSVEKLPKKCKEVFVLSRYDGLKNNEIAQKLEISLRTVETHISNALKVIKNHVALGLPFLLSLL